MALNLSKNKPAINLTKSQPKVSEYVIGLAWDAEGDLDSSVVVMKDGQRSDLVYYGNLNGAGIKHNGDARDGFASGDDETISINLNQVDGDEIIVVLTSYNSGTFGAANNPVARLYNEGSSTPLVEAQLDSECAFGTALELVKFTKEGQDWSFKNTSVTLGTSANGLQDVVDTYQ